MSSIFFYKIDQQQETTDNARYFKDGGKLDLDRIKIDISKRKCLYNRQGKFTSQGYSEINYTKIKKFISVVYISKMNLGNYIEVNYDKTYKKINTNEHSFEYYGMVNLIIKENGTIIIEADSSKEESGISKSLQVLKDLNIKYSKYKITNEMIEYIKKTYKWDKVKKSSIKVDTDSTTYVSYQKDPTSDKKSAVDMMYDNEGNFNNIQFFLPYKEELQCINIYLKENKITFKSYENIVGNNALEFWLYINEEFEKIRIKSYVKEINIESSDGAKTCKIAN